MNNMNYNIRDPNAKIDMSSEEMWKSYIFNLIKKIDESSRGFSMSMKNIDNIYEKNN